MAMSGNEWMKEHILYALQSRYTSSAKYDAKHMFSYLDFSCYFEANGQSLKMVKPHKRSYWQLKEKIQCKRMAMSGNEWMKEHILYALQSRYTSSAKYDAKHMFSYLDFSCYFEANGQSHIRFRLIQVLKNSMTWYFLTFRPLSSKLEFVYPQWSSGVEEQMLIFSSIQSRS